MEIRFRIHLMIKNFLIIILLIISAGLIFLLRNFNEEAIIEFNQSDMGFVIYVNKPCFDFPYGNTIFRDGTVHEATKALNKKYVTYKEANNWCYDYLTKKGFHPPKRYAD